MVGQPSRLTQPTLATPQAASSNRTFLALRSFRCRLIKACLFEPALGTLFDQSRRRAFSQNISPNPRGAFAAMGDDKTVSR